MLDLIVAGGQVLDGSGRPAVGADVGVADGRITEIGDLSATTAQRRIDATGRTVIPGIVDIHTHSDLTLLSDGRGRSMIRQGVTTELVGNCGLGPFPTTAASARRARESVAFIDVDKDVRWTWDDFTGYAAALEAARPSLNVAVLAGHVPLRLAAAPDQAGRLTPLELDTLLGLTGEALDAGAIGFSTGLMYPPAMSAGRDELLAVAEMVADRGALFAVHARNYANQLLEAVDEALDLARHSGCRLQFSHLAVAGRRNWGSVARALDRIDDARADGVDVGVDIYPYLAGSANLSQLLPGWAQVGGADAIAARVSDAGDRARIKAELPDVMVHDWDEIEVSFADGVEDVVGLTIEAVGRSWGLDPADAALDLIRMTRNDVMMVAYGRSADDLEAVLDHPAASIGSDGLALDPEGPTGVGRPHPRSYGCYPRLLGRFVREGRSTLARAVEMSTSRPADRIGLTDRGRLVEGAWADLVVLDQDRLDDRATFTRPGVFSPGIETVLVAGNVVVDEEEQDSDARPGRVLLR